MNWRQTILLKPNATNWDGPYFRLYECGIDYIQQALPAQRLFTHAMDTIGSWIYVLQGSLRYARGEDRHIVTAGQALITRRPEPGSILRTGTPEAPLHYLWIHVIGEPALNLFDYLHHKHGQIQNIPPASPAISHARRMIRLALQTSTRPAHFWSKETYHWLDAWWQAVQDHHQTSNRTTASVPKLGRLLSIQPGNFKAFAREMGYSRAYLTQKLSTEWGRTPGRALRDVRLRQAAQLLRTTSLSIRDISDKTGYATPSGFICAFVRLYKKTPGRYRRAHR